MRVFFWWIGGVWGWGGVWKIGVVFWKWGTRDESLIRFRRGRFGRSSGASCIPLGFLVFVYYLMQVVKSPDF
jgi:hypothetical protein